MPYCPACSASVPEGATACPTCGSTLIPTPSAADEEPSSGRALNTDDLQAELAKSLTPRYEILKLLGAGGMGAVFLAREPALRRLVAVKVLAPYLAADPRARSRFEREARAAAALSHPNVVRVYTVGETATDRLPYIVMQFVEGVTLAQWGTRRAKVTEREARRIIGEVAAALAAAHLRELVHRDVKPSNVLIETESGRPFVVDFGVSAALSAVDQTSKLTVTGMVVGTPAYMSPEQAAGEAVMPKSDVYSLGLVAYELLTGALPYSATSAMGWAAAHLRDPATPVGLRRPDLSPEVGRLIDRCLSKRPADRPDAHDIARALLPSLETEIPWPPPGLDWLRARGRVLARVALLTLAGGLTTMSALAYTPRILQVHAYWLSRFSPVFQSPGRIEVRDLGTTSQFLWQSLLIVGFTAFAASLVGLVTAGAQTVRFALTRQRRGWRWGTLVDVAVDHDGRSGLLLAGAREFASLEEATRQGALRMRRVRAAAELSAGLWVTLVGASWALAVVAGLVSNSSTGSPLPTAVYWTATLPALALLVVSAVAENLERRLTAAVTRRPAFRESEADIAAWYGASPKLDGPDPARPAPSRALLVSGEVVLVGLALATTLAFAAGVAAALVAAVATSRLGPAAVQFTGAIDLIDREDPIGTARQVLLPYLPASGRTNEPATASRLRRLLGEAASGETSLPDYDPSPATLQAAWRTAGTPFRNRLSLPSANQPLALSGPLGSSASSAPTIEVLRRATVHRIPADTVRLLERLGNHPRTIAFRELTRANHWDVWAPSANPATERWGGHILLGPSISPVPEAALANLLGAIGDVAQGDVARARGRLGENAAAGLRLLESPAVAAGWFGRRVLYDALVNLAELEQLAGDARRAPALRQAAQRLSFLTALVTFQLQGLAADPENLSQLKRILQDSHIPVDWRVRLMSRVFDGACTNPREILLGASPARPAAVFAAATGMSDVPHARELALAWTTPPSRAYFEQRGALGFLFRIGMCLSGS